MTVRVKDDILGFGVDCFTVEEGVSRIFSSLCAREKTWLACFNPHSYVLTLKNERLARALHEADWLIPDGIGVVMASKISGGRIKARVAAVDIFSGLSKRMNTMGSMSVFFLGADEKTLTTIDKQMAAVYPNIKVAGHYAPPFKDEYSEAEISSMVSAVNSAKPDVLWVGLSAPKQETFILENRFLLDATFIAGIGAVFDFFSGNIRRDPDSWFVNHGLEWLLRLVQEPRRLWRRVFISAPKFVIMVVRQRFKV